MQLAVFLKSRVVCDQEAIWNININSADFFPLHPQQTFENVSLACGPAWAALPSFRLVPLLKNNWGEGGKAALRKPSTLPFLPVFPRDLQSEGFVFNNRRTVCPCLSALRNILCSRAEAQLGEEGGSQSLLCSVLTGLRPGQAAPGSALGCRLLRLQDRPQSSDSEDNWSWGPSLRSLSGIFLPPAAPRTFHVACKGVPRPPGKWARSFQPASPGLGSQERSATSSAPASAPREGGVLGGV